MKPQGHEQRCQIFTVGGLPLGGSNVVPIQAAHGAELYYNAEISPWFYLTFDLRAINPVIRSQGPAIALGLRAKMDF